jgi:beta-glucosidase
VTGTDVPQVYLTLPARAGEPAKRLVKFDRITLKPGRTNQITVTINPSSADRPLSIWDPARHDWQIPKGHYTVSLGSSALDVRLAGGFDVR